MVIFKFICNVTFLRLMNTTNRKKLQLIPARYFPQTPPSAPQFKGQVLSLGKEIINVQLQKKEIFT